RERPGEPAGLRALRRRPAPYGRHDRGLPHVARRLDRGARVLRDEALQVRRRLPPQRVQVVCLRLPAAGGYRYRGRNHGDEVAVLARGACMANLQSSARSGPFWDSVEGRAPVPHAARTLGFEFIDADITRGTIEIAFTATEAFTNPAGNVLGAFL